MSAVDKSTMEREVSSEYPKPISTAKILVFVIISECLYVDMYIQNMCNLIQSFMCHRHSEPIQFNRLQFIITITITIK